MKKIIIIALSMLFFYGAIGEPKDSLDIMIGQMIQIGITDFGDASVRNELRNLIKTGKVGGVILFEKNLQKEDTKVALKKMIEEIQKEANIPLFIAIDEEGGYVNRLKPKYGFPKTVSAAYLGAMDDLDSTKFYSTQTAQTLSSLGFNVNYAPSVDVAINPSNPVIVKNERSYSKDPKMVVRHAAAYIEGHKPFNVATVLKHFPGHGSSQVDTHLGVADVSNSWQKKELEPYIALIKTGSVQAIMTAHIINQNLDEDLLPATLSKRIITDLLRKELGYEGVIFSDDMHMAAIIKNYGFKEAVVLAINAGVDCLIFSNNISPDEIISAEALHHHIKTQVLMGTIDVNSITQSYRRLIKLKSALGLNYLKY
jgi:beta-N-acetylhexosaminidase